MSTYVLDTSVAMAWYVPEAFAEPARGWQARMLEDRVHFVIPALHYWELANALRTNVRSRNLDAKLAMEIWTLHLDAPLQVVDPPAESIFALALEYDATAYDAVYIALALQLDVPLLTAERPSTPWVKRMGKRVHSILQ
jgi:predicted nucleic acid-binding protein